MNNSFEQVWQTLTTHLAPGTSVRNWTILKGYLGDAMKIVQVGRGEVVVKAPNAQSLLHVPRGEFEKVWRIWPAYKAEQVSRQEICEITYHSKYIISIFHWMEENKL